MTADIIQARYDQLDNIANRFGREAENTAALMQQVQRGVDALRQSGWEGQGATAFLGETEDQLFPAMKRLVEAFERSSAETCQLVETFQKAEKEAASPFHAEGKDKTGGFWSGVNDFFDGMAAELKDTITGLKDLVTDPIGAMKGIWYAITHPGEALDAITQPYRDDWNSGHPWRAIGRGTMAAISLIVSTKGADKAAKVLKGATVSDDMARIGSMGDDIARTGSIADDAARAGSVTDDAARAGSVADDVARTGSNIDKAARTEEIAKRTARLRERLDNGHSIARHGPEVTDDVLRKRITEGIAPDGVTSPVKSSTRFKSYHEWNLTRERSLSEIARREGVDLKTPPKPGAPTRYEITIDHGRPIGDGFIGQGSAKQIPHPSDSSKSIKVYDQTRHVDAIQRTRSTVTWNPNSQKWEVTQHFPVAN